MQGMQPPRRMRYSLESRCRFVRLVKDQRMAPEAAARACGAHRATGYRWLARFEAGGWAALRDQPSTPRMQPRRLSAEVESQIVAVRQATQAGPVVIAAITGRPASTVGKVLRRWGCSRLPRAERDPVRRYERERPGELLHVDTKQLGRFHVVGKRILKDGVHRNRRAGWQHLHVAIDDHSRLAYTEVLAGQDRTACAAFLRRAVAWYAATASRSSGCSPTTPRRITRTTGATPAASSASSAATRGPTRHAPTARPKPSSRPCSENGRTATPTHPHTTALALSPVTAGITDEDHTAPRRQATDQPRRTPPWSVHLARQLRRRHPHLPQPARVRAER